jgi:hypothetical protein
MSGRIGLAYNSLRPSLNPQPGLLRSESAPPLLAQAQDRAKRAKGIAERVSKISSARIIALKIMT